jgi:acyl-CoA hydrolase
MALTTYWADKYIENKCSAEQALSHIKPGQRVFIGSSCGEPQHLVRSLSELSVHLQAIEIIRLMTLETTPLTLIANKTKDQSLNIRSFYLGSAKTKGLPATSASSHPSICRRFRACLKAVCCRSMWHWSKFHRRMISAG